jgi:hypothetical protein
MFAQTFTNDRKTLNEFATTGGVYVIPPPKPKAPE